MARSSTAEPDYLYGVQASLLARRLCVYQRNRRDLGAWLHASRRDAAARILLADPSGVRPEHADLWLTGAGVPTPPLDAFLYGGQALYGLRVVAMLRLIRLRALYAHARELRHWVDARRRRVLADWLGPNAAAWVRAILSGGRGGEKGPVSAPDAPLESCSADALAWQGYCLLLRDGVLADNGPCALLPLALDARIAVAVPPVCEYADAGGSAAVVELAARGEEATP